jgi:hypothetical protein
MNLREIGWGVWTELIWVRRGTSSCEDGNELWEILEQLSDWRLIKKDTAPWS